MYASERKHDKYLLTLLAPWPHEDNTRNPKTNLETWKLYFPGNTSLISCLKTL